MSSELRSQLPRLGFVEDQELFRLSEARPPFPSPRRNFRDSRGLACGYALRFRSRGQRRFLPHLPLPPLLFAGKSNSLSFPNMFLNLSATTPYIGLRRLCFLARRGARHASPRTIAIPTKAFAFATSPPNQKPGGRRFRAARRVAKTLRSTMAPSTLPPTTVSSA